MARSPAGQGTSVHFAPRSREYAAKQWYLSGVAVRAPGRWLVEMNTRLFRSFGLTATSGWPLSRAGSFVTLTSVIALPEAPDVPDVAAVCAPADAGKTRTTGKPRTADLTRIDRGPLKTG